MDHEIVTKDEIKVIGAALRTANDRVQEIGRFWQEFMD